MVPTTAQRVKDPIDTGVTRTTTTVYAHQRQLHVCATRVSVCVHVQMVRSSRCGR